MLFVLFCLAVSIRHYHADAADVYMFGVVAQFEQRKLYAIWKPVMDEPERRTGLNFNLITTLRIPDFEMTGRGTTFKIYLPLIKDKVKETQPSILIKFSSSSLM